MSFFLTSCLLQLLEFYGHLGYNTDEEKNKLKNLLVLCGYEERAIEHILGAAKEP